MSDVRLEPSERGKSRPNAVCSFFHEVFYYIAPFASWQTTAKPQSFLLLTHRLAVELGETHSFLLLTHRLSAEPSEAHSFLLLTHRLAVELGEAHSFLLLTFFFVKEK